MLRATRWTRPRSTSAAIAAGALSLGTVSADARAQGATPPLAVHASRASVGGNSVERAVGLINDGQYAEARGVLQAAVRAQPTPWRLYNLGITLRALGSYREAAEVLSRYVEHPEPNADARRIGAVREEVARLRGSLAVLRLNLRPDAVEVRIDGRPAELEGTELHLDPGPHVMQLSAPGHVTDSREIELRPGDTQEISVALRPEAGALPRLQVETRVPGASIRVDGQLLGAGSIERAMTPGEHEVEVSSANHDPLRRRVRVSPDGTTRVEAALAARSSGVLPLVLVGGGALALGAVIGIVAAIAAR